MKKYDPVEYNRLKWIRNVETKNHPRNCKGHHRFCSLEYQWADNNSNLENMNRPINSAIPNAILPDQQQKASVKYENITEQQLDDWIAQSMNRTLNSILNPNKKFYIPPPFDEQLKNRYQKQRKNIKVEPDDSYFKTKKAHETQKSYLNHKKNKTLDLSQLVYDFKKLSPKTSIGKTPIQKRQYKSNPPKSQPKRRNAILLEKDSFYQRFIKQQNKNDQETVNNPKQEKKIVEELNKNKLYTFNYQSLRRKSQSNLGPTSITDYEGIHIEFPQDKVSLNKGNRKELQKQEQQQEIYRLKGNATAEKAYSMMQNLSTRTRRTFVSKFSMHQPTSKTFNNLKQPSVLQLKNQQAVQIMRKEKKGENIHKSNLGKKVLKLLQEMQIQPQPINPDMAQFQIHPEFIQFHNFDPQNMAHNWIKKAQNQYKNKNYQTSFQSYKQGIILQPDFFNAVYNFALLLKRQNRLKLSLQWFKVSKQFCADYQKVNFALALVYLKMEKFEQSFEEITNLINELLSQNRKVNVFYLYLKALALKKQGNWTEAKKYYRLVLDQSKPSNNSHLSMFIMSYVFAKKRRYSPHLSCIGNLKFREVAFLNIYQKGPRVYDSDQKDLLIKIKDFPFFKQFSQALTQKLIMVSSYEYHKKNEVIFVKPDQCIIVLDGLLEVKSHQKNVKIHQIISVLQRGDFIGANKIDNYRNSNINNWYYSRSDVQILRMNSLCFQSFWKGQITFDIDFKYNELKNVLLFKNLPDSTLFKLCEKMKLKKYSQNTVLFNDCSYKNKTFSKVGQGFTLIGNDHNQIQKKIIKNSNLKREINIEEFDQLKYEGLFVLRKGKVQIQDEQEFYNSDIISQRDFFGQNLIIQADGFHNYGRLVVASEQAQLYVLQVSDLVWFFSSGEKEKMRQNCENLQKRRSLEAIKDIRKRFYEYLSITQDLEIKRQK